MKFVAMLLLVCHWMACLWALAGRMSHEVRGDSWISALEAAKIGRKSNLDR